MAETENAAKRTREAPKGPVKPESAPVEAERASEARARQLVGLLRAEGAAASPPDEANGNGHLAGLQRSSANGNGNGHDAVQPADLRTLQRLAGNAAVAGLMAPRQRAPVQRAPIEQAQAVPLEGDETAERKAVKREVTEAVRAWMAAGAKPTDQPEAADADDSADVAPEDPVGAIGDPAQGAEADADRSPTAQAEAATATGPGGPAEGPEGVAEGGVAEATPPTPDATDGGGPAARGTLRSGAAARVAGQGGDAGSAEAATDEAQSAPSVAARAGAGASSRRAIAAPRQAQPQAPVEPAQARSTATRTTDTPPPRAGATTARVGGSTIDGAASRSSSRTPSAARSSATPRADAAPRRGPAAEGTAASAATGARPDADTERSSTTRSAASPATGTATRADTTSGQTSAGQVAERRPRQIRPQATSLALSEAATAVSATSAREAAGDTASARADGRARRAATQNEALERETTEAGPREMAERERFDDHEGQDKGMPEQREGRGPARGAIAAGSATTSSKGSPKAPKGRSGGPRSGGGSRKGKEALAAWQGAAGGAVGGVKPADMSATEGAKGAVTDGAKTITGTRESNKPDYQAEAKKVVPPTPEPPEREKMLDFTVPRGAITSIRKVGETKLESRSLKAAGAPPPLPSYITPESFVPSELTEQLSALEKMAADATPEKRMELDKKASALRAKIQGLKEAEGVSSGGEEISIGGEAAASAEAPESPEDRAVVAAALSELAGQQDDVVNEVVKKARVKVDPGKLSDKAKDAISAHRGSIASELTTELQGIASAAGIVDQDLDAKITAGKAKAKAEGAKAKQETETAAAEGKEELKAQGKKETGEQAQASSAVKEDAEAKVKAVEGGPEPEDIEAKVSEYLSKTITTGNNAKAAIATAVKKMTTKLDDKAKTKKRYFSSTGMKRSDAVRRYWRTELKDDEDPLAGQKKGEEEAVPTMRWLRAGKKGTDSEVGLIKNAVAAEQKSLNELVDSTVDLARDTVRDWGAEQEGTTRSWWEELWDDFMDWWDDVGTAADGWEEQQNAETRDTIISDAKAIDAIVTAKKEDIDKVKDEQLEGMDSERRAIIEQYLAAGGSNTIQLVVALTKNDITKRRIGQAVDDVDGQIMSWSWTEIDAICKSRNSSWPGADVLAGKILSGTGTTKVRKEKIFEGLAGAKTPLERKALEGAFAALAPEGSEKSLDEVLESRLSFDDEDRAQALRAGKSDEADAAAIEAALSLTSDNFAPDTESITKVLRGKSPEEIDAIKRAYKEKYGDDLDEVLEDTWFYDAEESDMVEALARGDTDAADAAEVHDALKNLGTDEAQYNKVFDNIRDEVRAQALKEGMSPAEVEYEIKRRTKAVADAYEKQYGQSLKQAVDEDFDDSEQKLAEAYLTGDADSIDAAKVLEEYDNTFNSDDDALEATVRNQKAKAEVYYKQHYASLEAQVRERRDAGLISEDEYRAQVKKVREDRAANEKQLVDKMTVDNTQKLREAYGDVSGGRDLDTDILDASQGYSHAELSYLLQTGGVLTDAEELHFALAGAGTDEATVKKLLYGRKPEEIERLKREYEAIHGTGSFDRDIRSEMDWGRDDEQILLMLDHDTSTPEGKLAYLKAAAELERSGLLYDDEDDPVGAGESIKLLEEQLKQYREIENDPKATKEQKLAAKKLLDMRMSGSEAQVKEFGDLKDAAVDEWVDYVKYGLVTIPGFQFLLLDDALLAGPMKMVLGGATEDTGQLLVEMGVSIIDIALTVATIASGGTAAPATVALSTLIKQGAYREVAKRIVVELGKQALESMVMAAIEISLSEKAWDSHDSVDILAEQAMTDFVVGLVVGGVIDVGTGSLSKNVRIDADGRIVVDGDGPKVDADGGGKVDGDGTRVDGDDPKSKLDEELPDVDDTGRPKADDGDGGSGKTDVDDTTKTKADDGGGAGKKGGEGGKPGGGDVPTKPGDGGGGKKGGDDGGGGKKGGDGGGGKGEGPGKVESEAEIAAKAGMDPKTVDFLKDFSDILGVRLQFRPTTKAAPGQIAGGAKAKVEVAKMKTAKSTDRLLTDSLDLGDADFGKVVLFEPHHPKFRPEGDPRRKAYDALDADGKAAVDTRYEQRLKEWDELNPNTNPYFQPGSGLDGGPALKMDGPFVKVQGIEGEYSFMTGDHDLFDVSWADGRPMTKEDYDAIIASLRHSGVNVEHGAHITWPRDRPQDFDPSPPPKGVGPEKALENRKRWEETIAEHTSDGAEPLIEISPDGVRETPADIVMPKWDEQGTVTPGFGQLKELESGGTTGGPDGGKTGGDSGGGPDSGKVGGDTDAPDSGKAEGDAGTPDGGKVEGGGGEPGGPVGGKPEADGGKPEAGGGKPEADGGKVDASTPKDVDATAKPDSTKLPDRTQEVPVVELTADNSAGLVGQLPGNERFDYQKNRDFFQSFVDEDPRLEVAVLKNDWTGEYLVVQGTPGDVHVTRDNPNWAIDLLDPKTRNDGNWRYVLHNHPVGANGFTPSTYRWPSGGDADWGTVVYPAVRERSRVQAELQYRIEEDGVLRDVQLVFGYEPSSSRPYYIRRPDEAPIDFATIEEYHRFMYEETGRTIGTIPDDFPGRRDHESYPGGQTDAADAGDVDPETTGVEEPTITDVDEGEQTGVWERPPQPGDTQEMPKFDPDKTQKFDPDKTQKIEAFDPDKTQEFDPDKTQKIEAFDPDKTQKIEAFDPDKTQPFMRLPEERATHTVPPSLRETQEMPAFDPNKTQEFDPDKTQPSMRMSEGQASPGQRTGTSPEQVSYSMIDEVPSAGPGERSVVLVGTEVDVPGPGTLTALELSQLQAIADEFQVALAIVGSRADGRGRNIETGLPHGKGPGTRSDIDVLIEGQHDIDSKGQLSESIREMADGVANIASATGFISPPAIIIRPRAGDTR